MRQLVLVLSFAVLAVLLAGCLSSSVVVCDKPYIRNGDDCCLDNDDNGVCDKDEGKAVASSGSDCPALDCSRCPGTVVARNVTVTKYVCERTRALVDDPLLCASEDVAPNPFQEYAPAKSPNATIIDVFTVRPACRDGFNGLEAHFKVGSSSPAITLQVKESPAEEWRDVHTYTRAAFEAYLYGVFCDKTCTRQAEFLLPTNKVYLFRAKFDYQNLYKTMKYSDEFVIDARQGGEYTSKLC